MFLSIIVRFFEHKELMKHNVDNLRYKSKYKKVGVLPIRKVWSNVSSIDPSSERNRK